MNEQRSQGYRDSTSGPELGYAVVRFVLGVNMMMHGLVRMMGDYRGFVSWVVESFQATVLPEFLLLGYGYVIPVIETVVGIGLILGFYTKENLVFLGVFMSTLVLGMCMKQNWSTVADQMIYVIVIYLLLYNIRNNAWSLDRYL